MPVASAKIGIIYPPPEVRSIVDKTASFVARNGPEFEGKIRQNETGNSKFNFLNPNDPYHAYYQHKVREIQENANKPPSAPDQPTPQAPTSQESSSTTSSTSTTSANVNNNATSAAAIPQSSLQSNLQKLTLNAKTQDTQSKIIEQIIIPKEPPSEYEFILDAPTLTNSDVDIIKLTAQFVARNGKAFQNNIINRESRNPQFDFLKPQHSHFTYYTRLVEHYSKILLPPKDLIDRLRKEIELPFSVLKDLAYRVEWEKIQQRERAREEELAEKERIAYAQIDWHDFVIVETVDYQPNEMGNFPPPTTPQDVGARIIAQERVERGDAMLLMNRIIEDEARVEISELSTKQIENNVDRNVEQIAMDEGSDEESEKQTKEKEVSKMQPPLPPLPPLPPQQPATSRSDLPLPPNPSNVIIRKDYDPKAKQTLQTSIKQGVEYFKSPITGELIPANRLSDHMRISMLDPNWLDQKKKENKAKEEQDEVLATGSSIENYLKSFAEFRSDMFGSGADEVVIGKKVGEEERRKEESVGWDGHSNSMDKTTKRAMTGITVEDQIKAIHQSQGLIDDDGNGLGSKIGPAVVPKIQTGMPGSQMASNMNFRPPMPQVPPPQPPSLPIGLAPSLGIPQAVPPKPDVMDEPAAKRLKTEETLIPEQDYLAQFGMLGPIKLNISVPNVPDKPEWNLNGQTLHLTLPLTESVNTIKSKIMEMLAMPPSKQKLQYEGMFIKDTNTLAFYNMSNESLIQLLLKDRGGRKK